MNKKKSVSYTKYGYIFSIPFVVAFLIFQLYPILYTTFIGFTNLHGLNSKDLSLVEGNIFQNFIDVVHIQSLRTALGNTAKIWIMNFIPQLGLALLLTAWFTDNRSKIKGMGFFKVVFYMPNIITAATIAILFSALFGYPVGPVNDILTSLHIQSGPVEYLINKTNAQNIVAFIQFWMWFGYTMVTLISGVIGIDPSIFEAAEIDGANRVQTFFLITLPCIRTIMLFTLVTSLIGGLNMFDIPKCFLDGQPDNATLTTSVFIFNQAFSGSYIYNKAAAASMIMFVIIVIFSSLLFYLLRDKDVAKMKKMKKQQAKAARLAGGI
jgi:multiple sugar transport system permease protein